jgi:predicted O-methyltransferase YrrM
LGKTIGERLRYLFSADKAGVILREMEIEAGARGLPILGRCRGQALIDVIRKIKPKRVLEIGTFMGYSTILMARELESDAEIITIDFNRDLARIAAENIKRAEVRPKIEVVVDDALNAIPRLGGQFDLVFIDGAKQQYLDYLQMSENRLHKGSVVVADNIGVFGDVMKNYLEYVRSSGRYSSRHVSADEEGVVTVIDEGGVYRGVDGIEISMKL